MGTSARSLAQSAWVLMIVFLACSSKTCSRKYCTPSSCGNIPNISYPFRLNHDPKSCGKSEFTLLCENNITVINLPSLKYHVHAINYSSQTIRVVDPGFQKNNCSSVPINSPTAYDPFLSSSPYTAIADPISFLKCLKPVNISYYVDTDACADASTSSTGTSLSQPRTYGYVMVGEIRSADVEEGCSLEWKTFINYSNHRDIKVTLNSLAYGFELQYSFDIPFTCGGPWSTNYKCFPHTVAEIESHFRIGDLPQ